MNKAYFAVIAAIAVIIVVVGVYSLTSESNPTNPASQYLSFSDGRQSKIFLLSAHSTYGVWTRNDTHMNWFTDGPTIHKGDPIIVVNATVRNDYTHEDKAGILSAVNSYDNHSEVAVTVKFYDKDNNIISAPQAYPRVDTNLGSNVFSFECGKPESFGQFFATANKNVARYEIVVLYVSSQPPP
jgi:hypothetical protein